MKIPIVTEEYLNIKTTQELIDILSKFPSETKIHGAFEDPINIFVIFHRNFGIKTISIED
jgi:hypothetical protein